MRNSRDMNNSTLDQTPTQAYVHEKKDDSYMFYMN